MAFKRRILIVEDNADSRELLALVLRRSGYEVDEATTGLAAIGQASATRPDLVIMDLSLPGITGDEATARLKADPSTRDIPVIVYTAFHKGASLVKRAMAVGPAEILYKPLNFVALQEVVGRYLSTEQLGQSIIREHNPPIGAARPSDNPATDLSAPCASGNASLVYTAGGVSSKSLTALDAYSPSRAVTRHSFC